MKVQQVKPGSGVTPAVALVNPHFPHNVGAAIRAASCYGVGQVFWTGNRVSLDNAQRRLPHQKKRMRLPREERMKGYRDVQMIHCDYFFDAFRPGQVTPVAVEIRPGSEPLHTFEHPDNPLYVFGPEDGSIPAATLQHCHRFVVIPSRHCLNLAAAVYTVLYDRHAKMIAAGLADPHELAEQRGFLEPDSMEGVLS